ncbi:PotD/PotF family extracellular solute-binding protein [Haladaptatus sp. DYF46]|uniref:ABC transporter substrate-binding protein n=1 Tax=Haladaptatus sp. DYF46 TaxID=2886041 RepID=UPI001E367434|nr:PotD/PotF family extracellular solute-binding protein [Haladaptatus sp. DYF46]
MSKYSAGDSRRTFLEAAGTAGAVGMTGLSGCLFSGGGGGSGGGSKTINILTWEEYADLKEQIEKRLDVTVKFTKSTSSSNMFTGWKSGKDEQFDIAVPNNNYVPKMMEADLVDPVPDDIVKNQSEIYDTFKQFSENQFTKDGKKYGVPIRFGWYGYSYDSRKIPEDHDQSYEILFSDKYKGTNLKGKVIMYDNHFKAMSATALYLGYKKAFEGNKVSLSEKQIKKVKQTLIDQKSNLQGYIAADPTYIKSFKQGNFLVGQSGRNEIVEMWANGTDWPKMATPKEGSLAWFESAVVSKKSENKDLAWKVINEFIAPKLGADLAKAGYSPSCNPKTQKHLSKEQNEMYGSIKPSRLEDFIPFKAVENEDAWQNAWDQVKTA